MGFPATKERERSDQLDARRDEMSYYKPREKRTAQLSARVTPTIKKGLADVMRLWTAMDKVELGEDEAGDVSEADAVNDLLMEAIVGAFAESVGIWPQTEAEWTEALKKVRAGQARARHKK